MTDQLITLQNSAILIPARMQSTRFPGKPLAPINGTPLVIYCAKNAIATGLDVYICTDSDEIFAVADFHGVKCFKTPKFNTGTDRIAWCSQKLDYQYFINLQGDEPLITADCLNQFIQRVNLTGRAQAIYTGVTRVASEMAFDYNNVKCAVSDNNKVLYMSRKALLSSLEEQNPYYKQTGLYAMSKESLISFSNLQPGKLEQLEKVELLRWIEADNLLYACLLDYTSISVDTPSDFVNVLDYLKLEHTEQ